MKNSKDAAVITGKVLFIIALFVGILLICPTILWLLWPVTITPLFGVEPISFLQAVGLWIVLSIVAGLFKSSKK